MIKDEITRREDNTKVGSGGCNRCAVSRPINATEMVEQSENWRIIVDTAFRLYGSVQRNQRSDRPGI